MKDQKLSQAVIEELKRHQTLQIKKAPDAINEMCVLEKKISDLQEGQQTLQKEVEAQKECFENKTSLLLTNMEALTLENKQLNEKLFEMNEIYRILQKSFAVFLEQLQLAGQELEAHQNYKLAYEELLEEKKALIQKLSEVLKDIEYKNHLIDHLRRSRAK